jgi:hypothetical protein
MRFCSADCLRAYQCRLDELTMMKIHHIDLSLPNWGGLVRKIALPKPSDGVTRAGVAT